MSELLVNTIKKADGSGSLSVPAESGTVVTTASPSLGRRNLIINGAMQVSQRGTSKTGVTTGGSGYYTVDRFGLGIDGDNDQLTVTMSQDSDAPDGFAYSLKVDVTTAETAIETDEQLNIYYFVETLDMLHAAYGTASAKTMTLSFWVKSPVTGTYGIAILDYPSSGARNTGVTYTIDAADTWEYKTVTFVGDTVGATQTISQAGLGIYFGLMVGPEREGTDNSTWAAFNKDAMYTGHNVSWGTSTDHYFNITGVQLEVGSVATPFEHRSYGEELALCQRYFYRRKANAQYYNFAIGRSYSTTKGTSVVTVPQSMRANPTFSTSGTFTYGHSSLTLTFHDNTNYSAFTLDSTGAFTANGAYAVEANDAGVRMDFDAEL